MSAVINNGGDLSSQVKEALPTHLSHYWGGVGMKELVLNGFKA